MPRKPGRDDGVVRYAVVGLGHISQTAMLPAFEHAANSELVAVVSGNAEKREAMKARYGLSRATDYDGLDALCQQGLIDAVYLAVPNHLHCAFTERVARHGVHVLCEKPMAVTEQECERMHRACEDHGAKLMIAYRLHFEGANVEAVRIARQELGDLRYFSAIFSQPVKAGNIRTNPIDQGGGSLYDIGIYCINAARYLFRDEPIEATAVMELARDPKQGSTYDQTVAATLRFPGGRLASILTCFDAVKRSAFRVVGTRGDLRMEPAFGYAENLMFHVTVDGKTRSERFPMRDQFAPQLVYFSDCILQDRRSEPDWREGLADVRIIRALHRSAQQRRPVQIEPVPQENRPNLDQVIDRPPVEPPEEVGASGPSR